MEDEYQATLLSASCSDDIIDASWFAGVGVHALIWVSIIDNKSKYAISQFLQFGFDGDDKWKGRRDTLLGALHSNPKAKFVTRVLQFGSEPLFDGVLSPPLLKAQILAAKANLSSLQIPVTVSDMAYSYQKVSVHSPLLVQMPTLNSSRARSTPMMVDYPYSTLQT